MIKNNTALLIIDVQQGLDNINYYGQRNNPNAEANIAALLKSWRASNRPVYHVRHHSTTPDSPLRPDAPGVAFKPEAKPIDGEPVITKNVNSGFIGTDLEAQLRAEAIETLVICGLTTEHCVSTTTRMAANLGFTVYLAGDATASHSKTTYTGDVVTADEVYRVALANLHNEFATVINADDLLKLAEAVTE